MKWPTCKDMGIYTFPAGFAEMAKRTWASVKLAARAFSDIGLLIIWPALYLVGYFISVTLEISQRNKDYDAELASRLKAMEEDI